MASNGAARKTFEKRGRSWLVNWRNGAVTGRTAKRLPICDTNLEQWSAKKQRINAAKSWIKVGISDLSIVLYPGDASLAVVSFKQNYASSNLDNIMHKRQYWIHEDDRWKILYEGAA